MTAEITKNLSMADYINRFLLDHGFSRVLEIGSMDGEGSTQVFIDTLKRLPNPFLWCLEVDPVRYQNLVQNTSQYPWVRTSMTSSIAKKDFLPHDFVTDVWESPYNGIPLGGYDQHTVLGWYQRDFAGLPDGESFLSGIPKGFFDVVLIDGGEFNGYSEYMLVKDKVRGLILDDTFKAYKNNQVCHELAHDKSWKCYAMNQNERNGWAMFVKVCE